MIRTRHLRRTTKMFALLVAVFLVLAYPAKHVQADLATNCLEAGAIYTASTDLKSQFHKIVVSANGMDAEFLFEIPEFLMDIAMTPDGDMFAIKAVMGGSPGIIKIDMCDGSYEEVVLNIPTFVNAASYDPISGGIALLGPPLYIMNTETYELQTRGGTEENWGGTSSGDIAVHPCDGVVYASLFNNLGTYDCGSGPGSNRNTVLVTLDLDTGLINEAIGCFTEDGEYVARIYGLAFDSLGRLIIGGGRTDGDNFVVDTATAEVSRINVEGNYTGSNGFATVPTVDICEESRICEYSGVSELTSDGIAICDINPQQSYCVDPSLLVDPSALDESIIQNRLEYTSGGKSGKGGEDGGKGTKRGRKRTLRRELGGKGKGGKGGKSGKGKGENVSSVEAAEDTAIGTYQLGCCPNEIDPPEYCLFGTVDGALVLADGGKGGKGKDGRRLPSQ